MQPEILKKLKFRFLISCIFIVLLLALGIFGSKHHEMSKLANLYSTSVRNPLLVGDLKEARNILLQSQAVFSGVIMTHWQTGKSIEHGNSSVWYIQKNLYFDLKQRNRLATLNFYYDVTASFLAFVLSSLAAIAVTTITYYKVRSYLESEISRRQEEVRLRTTERVSKQLGHDLRSPLSALNILAATINLSAEQSTIIKEVISRINSLAIDLLEIDRHSSEVRDMSKDDLMDTVNSLVKQKRIEHKRSSISIETKSTLTSRSGNISIQPEELNRVLSNLINNSVEALNNRPGTISVILQEISDKTIEVIVADDGPGIPSDIIQKLLVDENITTKRNGHGLGISGAKKIIYKCSGDLTIESNETHGTKIIIKLPLTIH